MDHKQHALKGQKLIAQGNALGIMAIGKSEEHTSDWSSDVCSSDLV